MRRTELAAVVLVRALVLVLAPSTVGLSGCGGGASEPTAGAAALPATAASPADPTRPPGAASVDGTVDGAKLAFVDAVVVAGTHGARVLLVDRADYCEHPSVAHPDARTLTLDLGAHGATSIAPGTYAVPEAFDDTSMALAARLDVVVGAGCRETKAVMGLSGSATVDQAKPSRIAGSFALALGRDAVRGTFAATPCAHAASPSPPVCDSP